MGRNRFVTPRTVRLTLSDGDWIDVKERLSVGEARYASSSFIGAYKTDGSRLPNLETLGMGNVLAYLVRWSFRDANDLPVSVSLDSLKALDLDTYREIEDAIEAHEQRVAMAASEQEKKVPETSAPDASPTS